MVRDAYSAGGQPQQADTSTANLTQELALLLAQSIAQGQSGKRPPGAAATGSELASLAALVSASQHQRSQPYKDGLSSLSYARPAHAPPAAPMSSMAPMAPAVSVPTAHGLLVPEPHHEDEPMPIPSTWRQPTVSDDDRWYRQQLGAAALGLIAGLIVVVPAVLWLSGYLGGPQAKASVTMAKSKTVPVTEYNAAASFDSRPAPVVKVDPGPPKVEPPPAVVERAALPTPQPQPRAETARSRTADLMAEAKRRIDGGYGRGAHAIHMTPETDASDAMMFMLAETHDPNMLASWQTKGIIANPERARSLYQKARDLGDGRAQQRLEWLTAN